MNKYQKALDRIKTINLDIVLNELGYEKACDVSIYGIHDYPTLEMNEDIQILQELVDKETPKKVNHETDYYDENSEDCYTYEYCPNCHMDYDLYEYLKYCPSCGQRLEWE